MRRCSGNAQGGCAGLSEASGQERIRGYITGWGPNEFTPLGTLKDYDVTRQFRDIKAPARL
ncbi:MAG: hypothetical protein ACLVJO_13325 [[Clostridium] scindens]